MKSVLVIGVGRFGLHLIRKLVEMGNEVMVIDISEDRLGDVMSIATNVQIGDCTKEQVLRSLGISNFDLCYVCVASDFQSSLEITSLLKEIGAKYVVSCASRDIQAKFLLRNGADEVAYPEKNLAERLAIRHSSDNIFDSIELAPDYSIYEIQPARAWLGHTIQDLNFRVEYNMTIIAAKSGETVLPMMNAHYTFKENEHIIVIGHKADLEKLLNVIEKN